jgi:hypothetical protein
MSEVDKIIATINPGKYQKKEDTPEGRQKFSDFKKIIGEDFQKALKQADPKPVSENMLSYNSSTDILEPIYFFVLELMENMNFKVEKLVDNFTSTPGGQHFSETGMKAARMQEEATKMMGHVNTVLRSVLNLVYDLKEFKMRLKHYEDLDSKDSTISSAAMQSLKQVWLDKVDAQRGQGSIHAMTTGGLGFATLRDAFLTADSPEKVENLDLNDRVKRIIKARLADFLTWLNESNRELNKRYNLEKSYLQSQVNSLMLYSRWVKPYLKAASDLTMNERNRDAELVNLFNTVRFDLTLLGKRKVNPKDAAIAGDLPSDFEKMKFEREYYSVVIVDFKFRAIPRQQGVLVGKTTMEFKSYALNEDELKKLDERLSETDLADVLKLVQGATDDSLKQIQDEINEFLEDKSPLKEKSSSTKKTSNDVNPFLALIGYYDWNDGNKKPEKKVDSGEKKIIVRGDDFIESHIRKLAEEGAKDSAFALFDVYKKGHGMASYT